MNTIEKTYKCLAIGLILSLFAGDCSSKHTCLIILHPKRNLGHTVPITHSSQQQIMSSSPSSDLGFGWKLI